MNKPISSTLIISTYNWHEALELVLMSVKNQEEYPAEVIIADDGSTIKTQETVARFQDKFPVPLVHVWHKDDGFTKAIILNKAIAKAKGDYIIQADGDCILHPAFVKDHLNFAEENTYLYGSRVNIQENHLEKLFGKKQVRFSAFSQGIKKRTRALYIPFLGNFYKKKNAFSKKYRGCNTSYFKKDFIAVNGYNEEFKGWGREDSELALRFHNYGIASRRLRYGGIVYHIYHKEKPKDGLHKNNKIEQTTIDKKVVWCKNGIDKYLSEKS
ncbi:glycosyltransferase family 2 protein [Tamlana sp. 2201CG12-4]|uniref:glycosyltransferase family 2 protein n=1 Tax=Tamlana sp. 2201CG12-4 TaxID=3112582 RepID=UPI002DBB2F77|nr:glycosyltransferase family 2 protein [Tamlana sp. 2201CG12-4]MEC3907607.1 glycosyltransferase family 2 protein [Tamlana sp. 2201CG12-4]